MTTGIMPCNGIVEERRRYNGSIPCRENKGLYDNEQSPSAQYGIVLKGKGAFDELGIKKLPSVKSLREEYTDLLEQKRKSYSAYKQSKNDMKELHNVRANVEYLLEISSPPQPQHRKISSIRLSAFRFQRSNGTRSHCHRQ